jgi:hypothetical protein
MIRGAIRSVAWRGVALTLIVMALALRIAVPQGVMADAAAGGFALVICTGHGPLVVDQPSSPKAPAQKSADGLCAFAVTGAAAPPPALVALANTAALYVQAPLNVHALDLAPGRGLAAPPPPSQGPPVLLT